MRARNIKPGFFENEELAECSYEARLLFIGLWCYADKRGKFEWRTKRIKAILFPYDNINIEDKLMELINQSLIIKYEVANNHYGMIPNFELHQRPHPNESESKFPSIGDTEIIEENFKSFPVLRKIVFKRDGYICNFCHSKKQLVIDHIIPIRLGGRNELLNLQVLCRSCNRLKVSFEEENLSIAEMKERIKKLNSTNHSMNKDELKNGVVHSDIMNPDIMNPDIMNPDISCEPNHVTYKNIISYLNMKIGSQFKSSSKATQRLIQARFNEGYNEDDFKKVIDIKVNKWFKDEKMKDYLRPQTLFSPKFESYLNEKPTETEEERNKRIRDEEAERFYRKHPEKAKEDGYELDGL